MRWFKHFSKAHRDTKIKRLINDFGAEGYAVYFYCLEQIADNLESDKTSFELEDDAELIGQALKVDTMKVEKIMKRCLSLDLFEMSVDGVVSCQKMAKFLDERFTRNPVLKEMIKGEHITRIKGLLSEDKSRHGVDKSREIRLDKIRLEEKDESSETSDTTTSFNTFKKELTALLVRAGINPKLYNWGAFNGAVKRLLDTIDLPTLLSALPGFEADKGAKAKGYPIAFFVNSLAGYAPRQEQSESVPLRTSEVVMAEFKQKEIESREQFYREHPDLNAKRNANINREES